VQGDLPMGVHLANRGVPTTSGEHAMSARLARKIALVTGASSGIGRAVAEAFAAEGASLALIAAPQDEPELQKVAHASEGIALVGDLGVPEIPQALVADVIRRLGRIDILVSNAGFASLESALDASVEHWDRLYAVNLRGSFLLCQAFGQHVKARRGGGTIVITSSTNAVMPESRQAAYNASKAGLLSLTKTLALEFASLGIRVNAVLPGMTRTPQTAAVLGDERFARAYLPAIPAGRFAEPDDIAPAYVFLASDEARYITGVELAVDGGLTIGVRWPEVDIGSDQSVTE
jgi:NAD(P)-dependent dehydrogenase (short-subunit alcohol dehydrogenase family)